MNEGIINKSFLEKDIEQIDYYKENEKQILHNVCNSFNLCMNNYKTDNTSKFLDKISKDENCIINLYNKRMKYIEILKNAIKRYDRLGTETVNRFDGDTYDR